MDQVHASTDSERLTWDEICRRYVDQWVVVVDIDWPDESSIDPSAATVIGAFRSRKEATPAVKQAHQIHQEVGCLFTGPLFGTDAK